MSGERQQGMGESNEFQPEEAKLTQCAKDGVSSALAFVVGWVCATLVALALSCVMAFALYLNGFIVPSFTSELPLDCKTTAMAMVLYSTIGASLVHAAYLVRHKSSAMSFRVAMKHALAGLLIFAAIKCLPVAFRAYPVVVGVVFVCFAAYVAYATYSDLRGRRFAKAICAVESCVAAVGFTAGLALLVAVVGVISGIPFASGAVGQDAGEDANADSVANSQAVQDVLSDEWAYRTLPERAEALQTVVHLESEHLQIEEPQVVLTFCAKGRASAYHPSTNTIEMNIVNVASGKGHYSLESVFFDAMSAYQCRVVTEGCKSSDPVQFSETELEEIRSGVEKVYATDTTDWERDFLNHETMYWKAFAYSMDQADACVEGDAGNNNA